MIHRVLTCMLPQWQLAFDLLPEEREAFAAVPAAEQEAFGREALLRRQAHWVRSHSAAAAGCCLPYRVYVLQILSVYLLRHVTLIML